MSTAMTRSTMVRPTTKRSTPNKVPRKIRIAATTMRCSAKDFLQVVLERTGNQTRRLVGIGGLHIEPVNEHAVPLYVDHQGAGCERDRVCQRQPTQRCLQLGLDFDNARIDVDMWCEHVAHHVDVCAHEFDHKNAAVLDEVMEPRRGETDVPPYIGLAGEQVGQYRRNQCAGADRLGCKG